jgi:flavin reductase (DIM6/NTAB) family NADH-FMN oxidoreductase RutF
VAGGEEAMGQERLAGDFKSAMHRVAKSVMVITMRERKRPLALAATSVDSLSMDPPSLLVCVNRAASIFRSLQLGSHFCVNVLSEDQVEIARRCGGAAVGETRFEVGAWRDHETGSPHLSDALAAIFCVTDGAFHYGTHGVFVGRVFETRLGRPTSPLIFSDGQYGARVEAISAEVVGAT